jgi:hypothetical protein
MPGCERAEQDAPAYQFVSAVFFELSLTHWRCERVKAMWKGELP